MKPVVLSQDAWYKLKERLQQDHPRSVVMVRWKMREVLGFTPREHEEWIGTPGYRTTVHLDFFDESKRTFFLLRYGDYIT